MNGKGLLILCNECVFTPLYCWWCPFFSGRALSLMAQIVPASSASSAQPLTPYSFLGPRLGDQDTIVHPVPGRNSTISRPLGRFSCCFVVSPCESLKFFGCVYCVHYPGVKLLGRRTGGFKTFNR